MQSQCTFLSVNRVVVLNNGKLDNRLKREECSFFWNFFAYLTNSHYVCCYYTKSQLSFYCFIRQHIYLYTPCTCYFSYIIFVESFLFATLVNECATVLAPLKEHTLVSTLALSQSIDLKRLHEFSYTKFE